MRRAAPIGNSHQFLVTPVSSKMAAWELVKRSTKSGWFQPRKARAEWKRNWCESGKIKVRVDTKFEGKSQICDFSSVFTLSWLWHERKSAWKWLTSASKGFFVHFNTESSDFGNFKSLVRILWFLFWCFHFSFREISLSYYSVLC